MPVSVRTVLLSGRRLRRRRTPRVDREGRRADLALVLEVEEEAVRALAGRGRREGDVRAGLGPAVAGLAVGVDVQVGEVAGAQGDQVAVCAEVGLEVGDGLAVPGDVQLQFARRAGAQAAVQRDLVAVDRRRWRSGSGSSAGS